MAVWTEQYNVHTLMLVKEGGMNIVVDWAVASSRSNIGYQITFNGIRRPGKNIDDLDRAKQAGLQFAMDMLIRALQECLH